MTAGATDVYVLSGLTIRSDLPLPLERTTAASCDVVVRQGPSAEVPWQRPTPDVIAELYDPEGGWPRYSFCRDAEGHIMARFYALADFRISPEADEVVWSADPATADGLVAVLIAGGVGAFLLASRGECVLHGSAVEYAHGEAVAFLGPSGRGKTTTATLLCARGHALLTDDLLHVARDGDEVRCVPGAPELRLRPAQRELVDAFVTPPSIRMTADERIAVRPAAERSQAPVLRCIVAPVPTRDGSGLRLRRLSPAESTHLLTTNGRIEGWRDPARLAHDLHVAAAVASRIPTFEARIPWGPPFPDGLADELVDAFSGAMAA